MGTLASELRPIAADLIDAPRVYIDANLPLGAVLAMRHELGWDVLFVMEHDDLRRAADVEHFRRARDLGRTLDCTVFRTVPPDPLPLAGQKISMTPGEHAGGGIDAGHRFSP